LTAYAATFVILISEPDSCPAGLVGLSVTI
jgi:hypothetical protein